MTPLMIIPLTTMTLGIWQVKRLFWKLDLIEKQKQTDPVEFECDLPEFTKVKAAGTFDYSSEIAVERPKSILNKVTRGQLKFTAFDLARPLPGLQFNRILVNRGWVPLGIKQLTRLPRIQDIRTNRNPRHNPQGRIVHDGCQ
jgi:cytochrome oxidase assembly protein ShyY1